MARSKENTNYINFLEKLPKTEILAILDCFSVEYKKNLKKEEYQTLILQNVDIITRYMLDLFQNDELCNIKYLLKHNGVVKVTFNHLLLKFLNNLTRLKIVFKINDSYVLPCEFVSSFTKELKKKDSFKKIKENTDEYALINGIIDAYGVIDYNFFYSIYSKKYKLSKTDALKRINNLSTFYEEYKIYLNKNNSYLASDMFKSFKECQGMLKKKTELAVYTLDEYVAINNFSFLNSKKAYKKLLKFLDRNYHIAKGSFKVVNKFILYPFFKEYQFDKDNAYLILASLIDKYFEFNSNRKKDKLMNLIMDLATEYPKWSLYGYSEREKAC